LAEAPCVIRLAQITALSEIAGRCCLIFSTEGGLKWNLGAFFCYFCTTHIGPIRSLVALAAQCRERTHMSHFLRKTWLDEEGQDIAEYSVMPFIASGEPPV
jgi:hypothetical protein